MSGPQPNSSSSSSPLDQLEQQLERSVENVRQIKIIVSDFQPQGQPGLNQKLQQIVKDLQEIDKLRPRVQDIQVPPEVFDYIDAGRNPQFFTKDCMEKALNKNEEEKGKVSGVKQEKWNPCAKLKGLLCLLIYYRSTPIACSRRAC